MKTKHENPLCYVSYIKPTICAAAYENDRGELECTGLTDTNRYMASCPFYAPKCYWRINDHDGFKKCDRTNFSDCDIDCQFFTKGEKDE